MGCLWAHFFRRLIAALAVASFTALNAVAAEGFDYSLGAGARTIPKGASLAGEAGYGRVLWGSNGDGEVMYGYVRPAARARTSLVVNAAEAEVQLAPVSFFVLAAGAGLSARNVDTATADCSLADCRGTLAARFASGTLLLGAGNWIAGLAHRISSMRSLDSAIRDFVDEDSALVGRNGGDDLVSNQVFLVWKANRRWAFGAFSSTQRMAVSSAANSARGFFSRLNEGPITVTLGLDLYESSTQERAAGTFVALSWTGLPSVGLH